jgi:hypothetical protein
MRSGIQPSHETYSLPPSLTRRRRTRVSVRNGSGIDLAIRCHRASLARFLYGGVRAFLLVGGAPGVVAVSRNPGRPKS